MADAAKTIKQVLTAGNITVAEVKTADGAVLWQLRQTIEVSSRGLEASNNLALFGETSRRTETRTVLLSEAQTQRAKENKEVFTANLERIQIWQIRSHYPFSTVTGGEAEEVVNPERDGDTVAYRVNFVAASPEAAMKVAKTLIGSSAKLELDEENLRIFLQTDGASRRSRSAQSVSDLYDDDDE